MNIEGASLAGASTYSKCLRVCVCVCVAEAGGPQHGSRPSLTECERPPAELILI